MVKWLKEYAAIIAVVLFVVIYAMAMAREADAASVDAVIGVGAGASHDSEILAQEILLEIDEKWQVGVFHMGKDPRISPTYGTVAARRVSWRAGKDLRPWAAFGAAYFDHSPDHFVSENLTYSLQVGLRWRNVVEFAWVHYSTAGRARENQGLDLATLRLVLPVR